MAASRLINRWKSRCCFCSENKSSNSLKRGIQIGKEVPLARNRADVKTNFLEEVKEDLAMFVKDGNDVKSFKSGNAQSGQNGVINNNADVKMKYDARVNECLKNLCEREPSFCYLLLTGGVVDPQKVMRLGKKAFGLSVERYSPSIRDMIISMENLVALSFKKDARVWLHKSSSRKCEPCRTPEGTPPKIPGSSQPDASCNEGEVTKDSARVLGEAVICADDDNSQGATPTYKVDFPPTPAISAEDISLNISDGQLVRPPKYEDPMRPSYDEHEDDSNSDHGDPEYEKRILGMYGQSYIDMLYQNENPCGRADVLRARSPPSDILENRFRNGGKSIYHNLNTCYQRNQIYDSPLLTRRSSSDHQLVVRENFHRKDAERCSFDDMMGSDHQLPSVPTHEPSLELQHLRRLESPFDRNRPAFYISDDEENALME